MPSTPRILFALLLVSLSACEPTPTKTPQPADDRFVQPAAPQPEPPEAVASEEASSDLDGERSEEPGEGSEVVAVAARESSETEEESPKADTDPEPFLRSRMKGPGDVASNLGGGADAIRSLGNLQGDSSVASAKGYGGLGLTGAGRGGGGKGYGGGVLIGESRVVARGAVAYKRKARSAPVDRVAPTEQYTNYGTNDFVDPTEDRFSTFAIDVDTGSYTIARSKLNGGQKPPRDSVRVEEFVNYFRYSYPKPKDRPFSVSMEAAPSPFATNEHTYLMRVGLQGMTIPAEERKPVHLVFLVDVSGSMSSSRKLGLAKKSLVHLTHNLRPNDTVALATYAGNTRVVLEPTYVGEKSRILEAIASLGAGGSTAMASGLDLAYRLADANFVGEHENRVIVLSDGDANVGRSDWQSIYAQIGKYVKKGVTLSTIGFGMGNYKDTMMEQLANHGNGNYFYVDGEAEAKRIFGDQIDGTLQVIARDVKIQVEFDPATVERYRLIGYENRDIADKDFRNDKVDAGEIGAGHAVTALYELVLRSEPAESVATVRVRHKEPRGSDVAGEAAFELKSAELRTTIGQSSKDFQFAAAVCAFAEKLRESPYAKHVTWDWIEEIAGSTTRDRSRRAEFVKLVRKARVAG